MPSLTRPCAGKFDESVALFYRKSPAQAVQQEFACTLCGQLVGVAVKKNEVVPVAHWPSVPKRQGTNRIAARYSRYHEALPKSPAQ